MSGVHITTGITQKGHG